MEYFVTMERRLLKFIMTPAMLAVWVFGLWLASKSGFMKEGWLHGKILLVFILSVFHLYLAYCMKKLQINHDNKGGKYYRMINEVPTLLLLAILILVVIKPF